MDKQINHLNSLLAAVANDQFTVGRGYMKAGEWRATVRITPPDEEPQESLMCLCTIGTSGDDFVSVPEYLELVRQEMHEAIRCNLFFLYCIDDDGELNELAEHFPQLVKYFS